MNRRKFLTAGSSIVSAYTGNEVGALVLGLWYVVSC
jgi:hypothetical protein